MKHFDAEKVEALVIEVRAICMQSPPDDWEPFDAWGSRCGYGENRAALDYVDEVDPSNSGDVAQHAAAVSDWNRAKRLRPLLAALRSSAREVEEPSEEKIRTFVHEQWLRYTHPEPGGTDRVVGAFGNAFHYIAQGIVRAALARFGQQGGIVQG